MAGVVITDSRFTNPKNAWTSSNGSFKTQREVLEQFPFHECAVTATIPPYAIARHSHLSSSLSVTSLEEKPSLKQVDRALEN
ncbi:hypothetical protein [Brunnivagina elsteri]|uniref:hypothetical protein n=1 Tax=Brunnivagina elsteri TaxID=1247191 RepID=UPI00117802C9|nr:hypothetical protein [Calothrix elsteri]